jgi:membrane-associated phospholipid phosphatase
MGAIWAGALVSGYLALTGCILVVGRERVAAAPLIAHWLLFVVVVGVTWHRGVRPWIRGWLPLAVLLLLYSEIPVLLRAVGHEGTFDRLVIGWEQTVFGGQPAAQWAAAMPNRWLSESLHAAYVSYYGIIFLVPVALWLARRREEFGEAVFVLMFTFVTCFTIYLFIPVAGPRYLWPAPAGIADGPVRNFALWLLETRSSQGTAFPSSHVAVASTQALLAIRYFGARGVLLALLTVLLAMGAVYGGFHYAVDVIAGAALGLATTTVAVAIAAALRRPQVQANASAPT